MVSRSRWYNLAVLAGLVVVGCDQMQPVGPIPYRESERAATELATKPKMRELIRTTLAERFGPDVQHIRVPAKSGLREGGIYLAGQMQIGDKVERVTETDPTTGKIHPVAGGYSLYRNNCLQCHGVFGAGDGPTSAGVFPRPRDYRPGIFKFTSTDPVNAKPSRDDLRRTLLYGLHGTSMPGFDAILTASEIEQVIDYMTFLAIRGQTEKELIEEAVNVTEKDDPEALEADTIDDIAKRVASSWTKAEGQVVRPKTPRVESTLASIERGRDLFLGANTSGPKLECVGCHGAKGLGNGSAFIDRDIFDNVVFRYIPLDQAIEQQYQAERERSSHDHAVAAHPADTKGVAEFLTTYPAILSILRKDHGLMRDGTVTDDQFDFQVKNNMPVVADAARALVPSLDDPEFRGYLVAKHNLWKDGSLDGWQNPLRPANLNDGVYKGGRRPIDLYWRLAKGINGAKMPAHAGILNDDQIWDIVNFVLALPDNPSLLKERMPAKTASVSQRGVR